MSVKAGQNPFKIPMVPLSLIFLLELVEEKKEIPASVTELYDRFSDIALGRWDKEKGIEVLFEYLVKKRFLASLAHIELHSKGRVEMPRTEFDQFLDGYAQEYDWDSEYVASFLKELERTGILQLTETVMFKHRSFLDYFGAFFIYDQHDKIEDVQGLIVKIYFDDNWGDAAFFSIGLRREVSETILGKIFDFAKDDIGGHLAKFGVGRLLQAGWHSKAKTRRTALEKGLAYGPILRKDFTDAADQQGNKLPEILADVIVLGIAETSYASSFLFSDQMELLKKYSKEPSSENIFSILSILFSLKDLMSKTELKVAVKAYSDLLDKHGDVVDQVKAFPFLMCLQKDDEATVKKLRKRAIALMKKYPEVISQVTKTPLGSRSKQ